MEVKAASFAAAQYAFACIVHSSGRILGISVSVYTKMYGYHIVFSDGLLVFK
jgi:hypothetical protein